MSVDLSDLRAGRELSDELRRILNTPYARKVAHAIPPVFIALRPKSSSPVSLLTGWVWKVVSGGASYVQEP